MNIQQNGKSSVFIRIRSQVVIQGNQEAENLNKDAINNFNANQSGSITS